MGDWDVVSTGEAPKKKAGAWDVVEPVAPQEPSAPISFGDTTLPQQKSSEQPQERGIIARAREGAAAPMHDLGFSEENRKNYPWLNHLQKAARTLDVAVKTPASILGGAAGAISGVAEKAIGPAWADRLQRDLHAMPMAVAPEVPMAAPELAAARRGSRLPPEGPIARPPPLPVEPPPLPPEVSAIPRQVDRPNVGVGLLNPDVEHALPAAQSRALSAAGNGGPLEGMHPDTIAFLRQRMENEGFNQHTIDQRLSEMSAHHFFGEIGPSLESDMGGIAGIAGPGRGEVMGSTRQRSLEGRERAQHMFDRAFGPEENLSQLKRITEIERSQAASPLFRQFRETVVTPTPEIEALLPRLQEAGALSEANKTMGIKGRAKNLGFVDGDGNVTRVPTAEAFDLAKRALDKKITTAVRDGHGSDVALYTDLKNDLVRALDSHPNVGDVWQRARKEHADPSAFLDAVKLGQEVLTGRVMADELPFITASFGDNQMRGLRIGMRSYYENLLGKKSTLTAEVLNSALSPNNLKKLQWAIGDEQAQALVSGMEHEQHMHNAPTRIHGNSVTANRSKAMETWSGGPDAEGITIGDVAGALKKPGKTAAGVALGAAEKFGLSQRRAAKEAKWARTREEASRIMTLQGPERDAVARYLVEQAPTSAYARGGRVPVSKPRMVKQNGFVYHLQSDGSYQ